MRPNGSRSGFPGTERLSAGLGAIFRSNGTPNAGVTILARQRNPYESTFPTEIVTCRVEGTGSPLRLFIKYGTKRFDGVFGHRGDVSYEARVYRDVLHPLRTSTPTFYGVFHDGRTGVPWLVIEYLKGGIQSSHSRDPNAMVRAARWIGRFHAANRRRVSSERLRFLRAYDETYYAGWALRTEELFSRLENRFPWLLPLCDDFGDFIPRLLAAPRTVIHGEYFGLNIIYQNGTSWPADWQSAAIAPGEIDLASLTHSWPRPVVRKCEREYARSRWSDGVPDDFMENLEAARLYMNFRWLGDPGLMAPQFGPSGRPIIPKRAKKFIKELHAVAVRLGRVE